MALTLLLFGLINEPEPLPNWFGLYLRKILIVNGYSWTEKVFQERQP